MSHPLLRPLEELIAKWRDDACDECEHDHCVACRVHFQDLQRVLRESCLSDLLEAGQAMREILRSQMGSEEMPYKDCPEERWDRALAKVKGKSA